MSIESLSDKAKPFYVTQEEIDATHPMNDGVTCYAEDEAAMILVGERHGKRELVDLVRTLLIRAHLSQPQPVAQGEAVAWRWRSPAMVEFNRPWELTSNVDFVELLIKDAGHVVEPLYATPTIPTGHRVVPVEPTEEMVFAAAKSVSGEWDDESADVKTGLLEIQRAALRDAIAASPSAGGV